MDPIDNTTDTPQDETQDSQQTTAAKVAAPAAAPSDNPLSNPKFRLFTLRVASNKEDRVRDSIVRKARIEGLEDKVGRVLVPVERVRTMKGGVRKEQERKKYPGYVFIELEPDQHGMIPQDVWFMVKETEGVGDFIQASGKPHPMASAEAARVLDEAEKKEQEPEVKSDFVQGDKIKVTDGAFEGFEGEVDELLPDKGQVRIITTIFGRPTPLELEYWQIEKVENLE